jgi:hypothetical protein
MLLAEETYIGNDFVFIIFGSCLTLCIFLFGDGKFSNCDCYEYYGTLNYVSKDLSTVFTI